MPDLSKTDTARLGRAFGAQSDLIPLFLLRYDRENTRRAYRRDLITLFGSDVVTLEMASAVTFTAVNEAVVRLESLGKSPATLRRHLASWRGFFSWLTALGFIDLNPADRHLVRRIPKGARDQLVTVLSKSQASGMLDSIDQSTDAGYRDFVLISTLLNCVLRRSEAAAMNVEDLGTSSGHSILTIRKAKGGSNQVVKVPNRLSALIDSYIRSHGYSSGPLWRSFSTNQSRGRRLSGSSIYKIVRKHAERSGISERVGAHTMRHTGCTLAIEGGASLQQVQSHARHKNIETTMRYVHQRDKLAHSAADFIDL